MKPLTDGNNPHHFPTSRQPIAPPEANDVHKRKAKMTFEAGYDPDNTDDDDDDEDDDDGE